MNNIQDRIVAFPYCKTTYAYWRAGLLAFHSCQVIGHNSSAYISYLFSALLRGVEAFTKSHILSLSSWGYEPGLFWCEPSLLTTTPMVHFNGRLCEDNSKWGHQVFCLLSKEIVGGKRHGASQRGSCLLFQRRSSSLVSQLGKACPHKS